MPLQGLMLFLFIIIIIPILFVFANQNVFFILISLILLYASIKNIYLKIFQAKASSEQEEDLSEELEQTMNVNIKKFKEGISVSKNLIIILFLTYCTYFIADFFFKIIIALVLTYRLFDIYKTFIDKKSETGSLFIIRLKAGLPIIIDLLTTVIIIIVSINKYYSFFV
jgi:hypothetical protein